MGKKIISAKILKMDENNQYGNAMTKPLPYDCIKKATKVPFFKSLTRYLIVYLTRTMLGIFLWLTLNSTIKLRKRCFLMKYTRLFLKKIKLSKHRSVLQLMSVISHNKEDLVRTFKANAKTRSTLEEKKVIPVIPLHFLVKRAGWLVTKIYQYFTFAQSQIKKDFVVMNQKSRQIAKTNLEKDFCKLQSNSNFGKDCRSNIQNRTLEPIYDEISEVAFIQKHGNIFDNEKYFQF